MRWERSPREWVQLEKEAGQGGLGNRTLKLWGEEEESAKENAQDAPVGEGESQMALNSNNNSSKYVYQGEASEQLWEIQVR